MRKGLSGSTLKIIAMISMLIDHTGLLFFRYDEQLYPVMRSIIGRIAFPIFCFLLVEGFEKTGNRARYAGRLFLWALLSEIPYDLVRTGDVWNPSRQNVMFTLLLGLLMMWGMEKVSGMKLQAWVSWLGTISLFAVAAGLAYCIRCDYTYKGMIAIALLYIFRENKWNQIIVGSAAFVWEPYAIFAFGPIALYDGRRGLKLKYLFYAFYPMHLLILYLLFIRL